MGIPVGRQVFSHIAMIQRATMTAVKIEVRTPMASVRAKPRTGPSPRLNMTSAATRWVTLASTMVAMAIS